MDRKILSIDADDDDSDIKSFTIFNEENTRRFKNATANQFNEFGEQLLDEITNKNALKEIEKVKQIKYILKRDKSKTYSKSILESYSYEDVLDIYHEIKNRKNGFANFIEFFNLFGR